MRLSLARYRHLLATYLKPQWRTVLLLLFLLLANIACSLFSPQIIARFIDGALAGEALQTLLNLALVFLGITCIQQIITIVEAYIAENVALTATNQLRADLMLHCLRLDLAFHSAHTPGEFIERIDGDVSALSNFFSRFLLSLLGNLLLLVGVLAIFYTLDWRIGLLLTVLVILCFLVVNRLRAFAAPRWERERKASADLFGFVEERLGGTEDIRSSGAVPYMLRGLAERARARLHALLRANTFGLLSWSALELTVALGLALSLALSIYLYAVTKEMTLSGIYLVFNYATMLNKPLEQISHQLRDLQQVAGSTTRIFSLLDTPVSIEDGAGSELPTGPLSVEFEGVSFSYAEDVPILKSLSFSLQPGQVLGLLGRTGSGKSTCAKLLTRLYDPGEGWLRLGGHDLRRLRLDDLYQRIGMVTQDVHILHTSVRNNLTLFDPAISDVQIIEALENLDLSDWYRALPRGLDTLLAPGGSGLSAGEAQLLAFARVFLKDPGLIILDEASSRLDPATERQLERAIDRLLEGRTSIIIAHRLATIQRADAILILEDGERLEYGSRETLARDADSRFSSLLRAGLEEALV
jgi:ATP-binding cassette subfamily B protein